MGFSTIKDGGGGSGGGGGSSEWTDTGSVLHPSEETVDNVVVGGTTTANSDIVLGVDGGAVFNEQSADVDFRVESNGNTHMLFVDGGGDTVGIGCIPVEAGSANPSALLVVSNRGTASTPASYAPLVVENDASAAYINIISNDEGVGEAWQGVLMGDQTDPDEAGLRYNCDTKKMYFSGNADAWSSSVLMVDHNTHGVGINLGTGTPGEALSVDGAVALKSKASAASAATDYSKFYALGSYPSDYVGMWHFDGNLTNEGGGANAVSVNSAATSAAQTALSDSTESLFLDASSSQYCTVADSSDWTWAGAFTVEMWARLDTESGTQMLITSATDDASFFRLRWDGDSNQFNVALLGTAFTAADTLVTDTWYHIALTRDGSNVVRLYRDGTHKGNGTISGTVDSTGGLTIGAYSHLSTATEYFDGYIDEMRILKGTAAYTGTGSFTPRTTQFPEFSEMFVLDGSGNQTQISPHNKDTGEWQYFSKNTITGKTVRINMEEVVSDLGKLTGKNYIKDE